MNTEALRWGGIVLVLAAVSTIVWQFMSVRPLRPPNSGPQGAKRSHARATHSWFRDIEPALLFLGAWAALLPLDKAREKFDENLRISGFWLGLTANELLGLSFLCGVTFGVLATVLALINGYPLAMGLVALCIGAAYPLARLNTMVQNRQISIGLGLPAAIDLAALSMGAGLDFPGAVRQIVKTAKDPQEPLIEELKRILQDLEIGNTRQQALMAFSERAPVDEVKDFVSSVVQADEKGTPLAEVLSIQARVMRNKRSVRAEESAAKAAAKLVGPIILVMIAVIAIIAGPVAINLMGTDFGF